MDIQLCTYRDRLFTNGRAYLQEYLRAHSASDTARFHKTRGVVEAAAIMACIANGVADMEQLIETAARISGAGKRMLHSILRENCGNDPERHLWFEDWPTPAECRFVLHNSASLTKLTR